MLKIVLVLIVVAVIAFIAVKIYNYRIEQKKEEAQREKKFREKQEEKEWREKSRKIYWNNLPNIYDKQSTQTLNKAYSLLQTLHQNRDCTTSQMLDIWGEARESLIELLGYPKWKYGNTDAYISNSALYYELDMKYIYQLLNKRK